MLTLFELSVAFDSIDHNTFLRRLRKSHRLVRKVIGRLVYIVLQPLQRQSTSLHDDIQFGAIGSSFWSATRLGPRTDLLSPLHW